MTPDHDASELTREVNARHDLTVVGAAERSRVLSSNADRVHAFLGEAGVVHDHHFDTGKLTIHLDRKAPQQGAFRPPTPRDAVLQTLPHSVRFSRIPHEPRGHGLDAL